MLSDKDRERIDELIDQTAWRIDTELEIMLRELPAEVDPQTTLKPLLVALIGVRPDLNHWFEPILMELLDDVIKDAARDRALVMKFGLLNPGQEGPP